MENIDMNKYLVLQKMSSMLYWWPKIEPLDIPKPRTIILELSGEELIQLEGHHKLQRRTTEKVYKNADKIGYPLFIRTDHFSSKHNYRNTCYVPTKNDLLQHIKTLLIDSDCVGAFGLPVNALVFREFIKLEHGFTAFNGLPIAKERRYLIRGGRVVDHFPYWPADAIRFWSVQEPKDWRKKLAELNKETPEEIELLTKYAEKVAKAIEGYWSVDFAKGANGTWYLIDMGRGEISWTPDKDKKEKKEKNGLKEFLSILEDDESASENTKN